jgi:RNA recognition motif-containing protein
VKQQSAAVEVKGVHKRPGNAKNALFVGRLHKKVTEDALRDVFRQFGRVVSVGISKSEKGPSFGFVEMEDEVTANTAYQYNQGREMYGIPIHVEKYGSKSSSKGSNNRYAIMHKCYY